MIRSLLLITLYLILQSAIYPVAAGAAQKCKDSVSATTPASDFLQYVNGTATDNTTGLMWMRCVLGQEWQKGACRGEARVFTWAEALKAASPNDYGGYSDWRLPNKNELASIVEESCVVPSINAKVFPATPATFFWTSSPYAGLATGAWSVDFGYGVITATEKSGKIHVRLVRDEE